VAAAVAAEDGATAVPPPELVQCIVHTAVPPPELLYPPVISKQQLESFYRRNDAVDAIGRVDEILFHYKPYELVSGLLIDEILFHYKPYELVSGLLIDSIDSLDLVSERAM
jgi:hypothetical protein